MKNFLNKLFLFIILSTNISFLNSTFANEVKEIIVKGARIDISEDNFGSSIFILDSEEIRLRGLRSAIDAISSSPEKRKLHLLHFLSLAALFLHCLK